MNADGGRIEAARADRSNAARAAGGQRDRGARRGLRLLESAAERWAASITSPRHAIFIKPGAYRFARSTACSQLPTAATTRHAGAA